MNDTLIAQIQSFTLEARSALETEAGQQLEGIYGWLQDGPFRDAARYPAVNEIGEANETRQKLEAYAEEEKTAGLSPREARGKLVRETAFTWLNRLVAMRMMEERKIIKSTVGKLDKSNNFIFWLTADGNEEMYTLHQKGALPQTAMGEGPSDIAYRKFMLWQCAQLAKDVSVLFDPENLSSRLFPRPPVLKKIVELMNRQDLAEAWQAGNEETVGWVYEGFIEEENKAVFEKFGKGKKVKPDEIGAATQRFTPRWIVRFLVENSLGRLWMEMHPDSRLNENLGYLVTTPRIERPLQAVKDITLLDPSCGSMHFGLVAFDLFVEMYREELEKAGQPGWTNTPSVASVDEIPASIIANNIYGIDIDLRAVQLSALILFLKARALNKDCVYSDNNLACSNVEAVTGGRLEEFIRQSQFSHPIYERILRAMVSRMKDSDQLGSLLRLEKTLEQLVAEERGKVEAKKQTELPFPGLTTDQFKTREGIEEFFEILLEQLMRHLDGFVQNSRVRGLDPGHFAAEAAKGLRYLRLVSRQYDIVATNPPYMSRRNMSTVIAKHLDDNYTKTKGDLFAAFIARCLELAASKGKVAMVTQQSFMFIKTYEKMREYLRGIACSDSMAHLGPKAFPNITGEKVNTTAFVLCKEMNATIRQEHQGTYFRLVREKDSEAKRRAFEETLALVKTGLPHPLVFFCRQEDFDAVPGKPWAYWLPPKLRLFFQQLDIIRDAAPPRVGLQTADNARFLRKWWEVGHLRSEYNATSCAHSRNTGKRWFSYMKGGTPIPWFGNQEHVVNWENNGAEIDAFRPRAVIRNPNFYFRKGITWSDVSSKGFAGRLSPGGFIHDVSGMTCFPEEKKALEVLSVFNSTVAKYLLGALNPTIHYQVGDIERLPIPDRSSETLDSMVEKAITLAKRDSTDSEITYDFIHPPVSVTHVDKRHTRLLEIEEEIDIEVTRLYGLTDADRLTLKAELEGTTPVSDEETDSEGSSENEDDDDTTESAWTDSALARAWISYAFGAVIGRYAIGEPEGLGQGDFDEQTAAAIRDLLDEDGVMVSELGHPHDITARTLRCLQLMRGKETAHSLIRKSAGADADPEELLRGFLDRFSGNPEASFWRHHFQLYRKRPIFWPLQSPKRKFTVWVFQERFNRDTLFKVRSEFADPKARWLEARIKELKDKAGKSTGAEKRKAEKEASQLADILDDVQEFSKRLNAIIQRGYTPRIDDGVLINAAPLWELLPSWPDTKKAWQELEDEKYEWAHQAMDHWPDRVREKCKTNKSFAIAHGLE
jgi:hypothetical protein